MRLVLPLHTAPGKSTYVQGRQLHQTAPAHRIGLADYGFLPLLILSFLRVRRTAFSWRRATGQRSRLRLEMQIVHRVPR